MFPSLYVLIYSIIIPYRLMNELFYKTDQCGIRCPKRRNYDFANMQSAPNQYNMCCFYQYVATTFKLVEVLHFHFQTIAINKTEHYSIFYEFSCFFNHHQVGKTPSQVLLALSLTFFLNWLSK